MGGRHSQTTGSWQGFVADIHRQRGGGGAGAGVLFRRSPSTGAGRGAPACVGPQGASSLVPGGGSTWWSGSALEASVAGEAPSLLQEFQEVQ